jgi:hypothetical protein
MSRGMFIQKSRLEAKEIVIPSNKIILNPAFNNEWGKLKKQIG